MAIPPFNLDSRDSSRDQDDDNELFDALGITNWREVFKTDEDFDAKGFRPLTTYSAEEILYKMLEQPILRYIGKIYYNVALQLYSLYIEYDEPVR